jgi:hypothetical protein
LIATQGLREILCDEIRSAMPYPVQSCSPEDLASDPSLAIGALAAAPVYSVGRADKLFPKDRPVIAVMFNKADDHIRRIRELTQPSTIAVVSAVPASWKWLEEFSHRHRNASPAQRVTAA